MKRKDAVGLLHLYEPDVQERCFSRRAASRRSSC